MQKQYPGNKFIDGNQIRIEYGNSGFFSKGSLFNKERYKLDIKKKTPAFLAKNLLVVAFSD
jgi:hypothetical protein